MRIKSLAMASLAALAVGTLAAGPAFAADPVDGSAATAPANLINPDATTTLTIHKYSGNPTGTGGNGQPVTIDTTKNKPLGGIAFDIYKVNGVDLTTNDGRAAAAILVNHTITQQEITNKKITVGNTSKSLADPSTVTTGEDGSAQFTGEVGLYLVVENLTNSTDAGSISPSEPFLVTLPMTDATTKTAWDYDVDVYPKNQISTTSKKVLDGNPGTENQDTYQVGQTITYQLTGDISAADYNGDGTTNGADIGFFAFSDDLAASLTDPKVTAVEIVDKNGQVADTDTLTADTDYKFTTTDLDGAKTINVSATSDGLDKIAKHDGATVRVTFTATVSTLPENGLVENTANFIPNNKWLTGRGNPPQDPGDNPPLDTPGIPTDKVTSKFGDLVIKKVSQDGSTALSGAVFALYRDANLDGRCTAADDITGKTALVSSDATTDDGLTKFGGIQLSNWYNGEAQDTQHGYCIVETTAPDGYELLAEPIYFTLTTEGTVTDLSTAFADTDRDANTSDGTGGNLLVKDMPSNFGNRLPLTGGAGAGLIGFAGLAIVAGAGGGLMIKRRRNQQR